MLRAKFVVLIFLAATTARAEVDLETDAGFFGAGKNPHQEDDLDRAYRTKEASKASDELKVEDVTMQGEIQSAKPGLMSKTEAADIDRRLLAENKRRRQAIVKTLAGNSSIVKACIDKNKKEFQGSQITLKWMIAPSGKVLMADVTDSDFTSQEVQACVRASALKLDFSAAAIQQYKKSLVEYTYKVNLLKSRAPASVQTGVQPGVQPRRQRK
jgi:hypothetical protein